jgi:synaptobrevin homolog YKT6
MTFLAQTVAERTSPGTRQEVEEKGSHCYAYGTSVGICGIVITNAEYPRMVAHSLNSKIVDDFQKSHPKSSYMMVTRAPGAEDPIKWPALSDYMTRYLQPSEADSITRAQMELDETKVILHKTIESVLERGEKIDNLVAKSDGLSASSKMFVAFALTVWGLMLTRTGFIRVRRSRTREFLPFLADNSAY